VMGSVSAAGAATTRWTSGEEPPEPKSSVTFAINERVQRILLWVNQNFLLAEDLKVEAGQPLHVVFISLRGSGPLWIRMENNGQVTIKTDDMDLAGDLINALATFLNIEELPVTADFPAEIETLREVLVRVDDFHAVRQKLTAEMADHSNLIRNLVVRAEDARLMGDMRNMKKGYMELYDLNRDLINGYKIRCNNHQQLLNGLRVVNQTIQRAGNLRFGKCKSSLITAARAAIKANNVQQLVKIIRTGNA